MSKTSAAFLFVVLILFVAFATKVGADPLIDKQVVPTKLDVPVLPPLIVHQEIDARITTQIPAWAWVQPTFTPINQWTTYDPKWRVVKPVKVKPSKKFDEK